MQIELGALAPKLVEQLAGHVSGFDLAILDEDADAITRLYVRGYLPPSVVDMARKKLIKGIKLAVRKAAALVGEG